MDKKTQYTKAVLVRGLSPEVVAILDELAMAQDRSREYVARTILTKAASDFSKRKQARERVTA
jgi:predicted transcriptional regulator